MRINNHEHTDVHEYTGGFAADSNGSLAFMYGILVQALRLGHWVILDELKDGFITPRDLLRWAGRGPSSKIELAREGYMLLAERLRTLEEKDCVKEVIEKHL